MKDERINKILQVLINAKNGDYSVNETVTGADDIAEISSLVNSLIGRLNQISSKTELAQAAFDESLKKYRHFNSLLQSVFFVYSYIGDGDFNFIYISEETEALLGIDSKRIIEDYNRLLELVKPEDRRAFVDVIKSSKDSINQWQHELRIKTDGSYRWYRCSARRDYDLGEGNIWSGVLLDITGQKESSELISLQKAEIELAYMELQSVIQELSATNEEMEAINEELTASQDELIQREVELQRNLRETTYRYDISRALNGIDTESHVLDVLIEQAEIFSEACVILFSNRYNGKGRIVTVRRINPFKSGIEIAILKKNRDIIVSDYDNTWQLNDTEPFICNNLERDGRVIPIAKKAYAESGIKSFAIFPMNSGGAWVGDIGVFNTKSDYFDREKIVLYSTLAEQGAVALAAARLRDEISSSRQRMSQIVEQSPLAIIEWSTTLSIVSWNSSAERIFMHSVDWAVGRDCRAIVDETYEKDFTDELQSVLSGTYSAHYEAECRRGDDSIIVCEWHFAPIIDGRGKVSGIVSIAEDITEKRKYSAALEQEKALLRTLIDMIPDPIYMKDMSGRKTLANPVDVYLMGASNEADVIGKNDFDVYSPEDAAKFWEDDEKVLFEGQKILNREEEFILNDGSTLNILTSKVPLKNENGEIVGLLGVGRDITDRKKYEHELESSLKQTRMRYDFSRKFATCRNVEEVIDVIISESKINTQVSIGISTLISKDTELVFKVRRYEEYDSGLPAPVKPGTVINESNDDFVRNLYSDKIIIADPVVSSNEIDRKFKKIFAVSGVQSYSLFPISGAMEWFGFIAGASRVQGVMDEDFVQHFSILSEQASIAFRATILRERIAESQNRLMLLFEQSPLGIIESNTEMKVVFWNKAAQTIFGYSYSEAVGNDVFSLIFGDTPDQRFADDWRKVSSTGRQIQSICQCTTMEGGKLICNFFTSAITGNDGVIKGIVSMVQDVTEREKAFAEKKRLEEDLQHAQKIESVGRLAGGVAHDFNNMLTVILGRTELIKSRINGNSEIKDDIVEIEKAARHSKDVTTQLLAFSRKQIIKPEIINMNERFPELRRTLIRLIGEDIEIAYIPGRDLWNIKFDPFQIDQIIMNLSLNSRDAMPDGGKLSIQTDNVTIDENESIARPEFRAGEFVRITLRDSGTGMDSETLQYIFEPFFTTKEIGRGTGLGLATVYGMVKQNNGFITVDSSPGEGTSFEIYIPRSYEDISAVIKSCSIKPVKGEGTILLVEDDMLVRRMVSAMLTQLGYYTMIAETPGQAVAIFREKSESIDMVISDVIMPEMSGVDLRTELEKHSSGVKILFMSGYTADVLMSKGGLEEGVNFISKPFSISELSDKVREVISS